MLEPSLFHIITGSLHITVCNLDIGRSTEGMWTWDNSEFNTTKLWNIDRHDTLMVLEGLTWSFAVSADKDFGPLMSRRLWAFEHQPGAGFGPCHRSCPPGPVNRLLRVCLADPTGDTASGLWLNWGLAVQGSVGLLPCSLCTAGTQGWLGWPPPCQAPCHVSGVLSGVLGRSHLTEGGERLLVGFPGKESTCSVEDLV